MKTSSPKILYCTSHCLSGRSYGGQLRSLHLARLLQSRADVRVALFPLAPIDAEAITGTRDEFDVRSIFEFERRPIRSWRERIGHEFDPYFANTHHAALLESAARRFDELAAEHDLIWFHGIRIPNSIGRRSWSKAILDIDDVPSLFYQSALRSARSPREAAMAWRHRLLWRRREKALRQRFTAIGVCSNRDKAYLGGGEHVHVIPNGFEPPASMPAIHPATPPRIGFIGKLEYAPNEDGVRWFIEHVWPRIETIYPDARLRLVGVGSERIAIPQNANIDRLGWVADPAEEVASWSCMIVPLRMGAGTRIKIAEAFSRRCPVVSTRLGAFGYDVSDGEEVLLADTSKAFASSCLRMISDRALATRMADAAWTRFNAEWSWSAIGSKVATALHYALHQSTPTIARDISQVSGLPHDLADRSPAI